MRGVSDSEERNVRGGNVRIRMASAVTTISDRCPINSYTTSRVKTPSTPNWILLTPLAGCKVSLRAKLARCRLGIWLS